MEAGSVHVVITLAANGKDITGTFGCDGSDLVSFQGWLELLRHLEAAGASAAELATPS